MQSVFLAYAIMPLGYCFKFKSLQQITVLSPSGGALRTHCHSDALFACFSYDTLPAKAEGSDS